MNKGIKISKLSTLGDWKKIFEYWMEELEIIIKLSNGKEVPFVHAEHGSMHHFGVSASKAGFGTIRELIGKRNGNNARLDLCMLSDNIVDIVEAKWLEFDCSQSIPRIRIADRLKDACIDAASYENHHALFESTEKKLRRTGILFLSPYFKDEVKENHISDLLYFISEDIKHDILAWSFPRNLEKLRYWGRTYPGTTAIAKRI